MKSIIILGSSRSDGETRGVVDRLVEITGFEVLDLLNYQIGHYSYTHQNQDDDFKILIAKILYKYDVLIFATSVYWYAMSGILKTFFDRITDLLDTDKALGREFRKKSMAVLSSSNGNNLGDSFWLPFKATSDYLGMQYLGNLHTVYGVNAAENLGKFALLINNATNEKL
jgi:multimeric flavodoxin WrbA